MQRRNPCGSEIPEWLQEFKENLVDDEIPLQGGSHANSSHEVSLEPTPTMQRRNPCGSEIPEWLQEFGENLVDDEIPGNHYREALTPVLLMKFL